MTKICHVIVVLFPLSCARYHWPESLQTFSLMPAQWAGHRRPSVLFVVTFYGICCAVTPFSGYMKFVLTLCGILLYVT